MVHGSWRIPTAGPGIRKKISVREGGSGALHPKRFQLLPMSPNLADKEDDWKKQFRGIFGIQG